MDAMYLQGKIKRSPISKVIQVKIQQKTSHLTNNLYKFVKQQSEKRRNLKTQQQQFERQIEKKLSEQPSQVIGYSVIRRRRVSDYQKNSKKLKAQSLTPQRSYELQTKTSVLKKERIISMSTQKNSYLNKNKYINDLSFSNIHCHKTTDLSLNQMGRKDIKQIRNRVNKKVSFATCIPKQIQTEPCEEQKQFSTQMDYYRHVLGYIRKTSKKFEESMIKTQKKFNIFSNINSRIDKHFDGLILEEKDFPQNLFDDYQKIPDAERYKFSSNDILQNVLSRNNQQVQNWIQIYKKKNMREKGLLLAKETFKKQIITKQQIRFYEKMIKKQKLHQENIKFQQLQQHKHWHSDYPPTILTSQHKTQSDKAQIQSKSRGKCSDIGCGKMFNQVKEYEKRKIMSKTVYQPRRSKHFTMIEQKTIRKTIPINQIQTNEDL